MKTARQKLYKKMRNVLRNNYPKSQSKGSNILMKPNLVEKYEKKQRDLKRLKNKRPVPNKPIVLKKV